MLEPPRVRLLCALIALCLPLPGWGQHPGTTRKVVLEKSGGGYHRKLTEAPVPPVGDHQVLIRVRAVALNRGDIEALEGDRGPDRSGLLVASDAAGDVVAVGKAVTHVRPGSRITSTYFKNWTDGPPSNAADSRPHRVDRLRGAARAAQGRCRTDPGHRRGLCVRSAVRGGRGRPDHSDEQLG